MRFASESIGQLAGALAKAQGELTNPSKSQTAVLEPGRKNEAAQSYRYAPLSAGLDIVRSILVKYDLAVIQTTQLDDAAMVNLTTTLAHASGEWISACWPVCRVDDVAHPRRMGAALTYARRYGLFTIVGLAGEDDLDAPESPFDADRRGGEIRIEGSDGIGAFEHGRFEAGPRRSAKPSQGSDELGPGRIETAAVTGTIARRDAQKNAGSASSEGPGPNRNGTDGQHGGKSARRWRAANPTEALVELANVLDGDGLLRWALACLSVRSAMDEGARAALSEAFRARAEAIGAEPELLLAFEAPALSGPGSSDGGPQLSCQPDA